MAFFSSIGKLFGFGHDDADYNEIAIDATVTPLRSTSDGEDSNDSYESSDVSLELSEPQPVKLPEIPVEQIFETVVDIFNKSLPDFIAQNLDKEKQKRQIFEALDKSIQQHLKDLAQNADREAAIRWQNERKRLMTEIDRQKENYKKQTEAEEGLRSRHLSAERQKRALTERIHDLEGQVASLEAEREQYDLENKSLINKLRAVAVQDGYNEPTDTSALDNQIADLQAQLQKANELNNQLNQAQSQHNDDMEQLVAKLQLAEAMTREAQSIASTAKNELKERETVIENLNGEISALKSSARISDDKATVDLSTITELEEQNKELTQKIDALTEELNNANESLQTLEIIEAQLEKFEEIKQKKDAKIKELSTSRESLLERIKLLENERLGFKRTVEDNIVAQSESEIKLRDEINRLRQEIANLRQTAAEAVDHVIPYSLDETTDQTESVSSDIPAKISAIDESLDNTDWLVATPPDGISMRNFVKSDESSDFGYQAPAARKTIPDNDAQMSLWDDEF